MPGFWSEEVADDLALYSSDGYAEYYHRADSCFGTGVGRDGADSVHLCRLFPSASSGKHSGSVYGVALSSVCDFYKWNGYGGAAAIGIRYGIGTDYDYSAGEFAGECVEKVF